MGSSVSRYVGALPLIGILALFALGACTPVFSEAQVSLEIRPVALKTSAQQSAFPNAYEPRTATGLVAEGFCYAVNVTAPDLTIPGTSQKDTCGHGPRGLGRSFGPFAYGDEAVVRVHAGPDRQVDLIGFPVPVGTRADCRGELKFVTEDAEPGSSERRVRLFYDGVDVVEVSERALFVFARSEATDFKAGPQKLWMNAVAWAPVATTPGELFESPRVYGCDEDESSVLGVSETYVDFGSRWNWSERMLTISNNSDRLMSIGAFFEGDPLIAPLGFARSGSEHLFPGGDPLRTDACGPELAAGAQCTIEVEFDPRRVDFESYGQQIQAVLNLKYSFDGGEWEYLPVQLSGVASLPTLAHKFKLTGSPDWSDYLDDTSVSTIPQGSYGTIEIQVMDEGEISFQGFDVPAGFFTHSLSSCGWGGGIDCLQLPILSNVGGGCMLCLYNESADDSEHTLLFQYLNRVKAVRLKGGP